VTDITHQVGSARSLEYVMTFVRLISPAFRSGLLMVAGTVLIALPFVLGLGAAALTTGVAIGALMVALALAGIDSGGRGTLPISAQAVYDRGVAFGLIVVAAVFGIADEPDAALVFASVGVVALIVTSITRYSARPA
jgi:hypothetical protein